MANGSIIEFPHNAIVNVAGSQHSTDGDSGAQDASGFHYLLAGIDITAITGSSQADFNVRLRWALSGDTVTFGYWMQGQV